MENMTRDEAAAFCRISRSTVDRLIRKGTIKSVKVGQRRLIPKKAIEELYQQQNKGGKDNAGNGNNR